MPYDVFLTGATGYIGRHVIPELLHAGHRVRALVREGSESKLARGAIAVRGNALDAATFRNELAPSDTLIHLVGVAHPSPSKTAEFRAIDLVSIQQTATAIAGSTIRHVIYLSVAQPAPMMREYLAVRAEGESLLRASNIASTFVRPWYVLGPGHRWPYAVLPFYWLAMLVPSSRETARRLYPVPLRNVVRAIVAAIDAPPDGTRIIDTEALRRA